MHPAYTIGFFKLVPLDKSHFSRRLILDPMQRPVLVQNASIVSRLVCLKHLGQHRPLPPRLQPYIVHQQVYVRDEVERHVQRTAGASFVAEDEVLLALAGLLGARLRWPRRIENLPRSCLSTSLMSVARSAPFWRRPVPNLTKRSEESFLLFHPVAQIIASVSSPSPLSMWRLSPAYKGFNKGLLDLLVNGKHDRQESF